MKANIFVSYRRTHLESVERAVAALRKANVKVFLDVEDIDPLEEFPSRIRQRLSQSHAFLVWWSSDYAASEHCMQELLLAWEYARRKSSDLASRIWILNPESSANHIFAGDLANHSYLLPPTAGLETQWAQSLATRAQRLLSGGPLASNSDVPNFFDRLRKFVPRPFRAADDKTPEFTFPSGSLSGVPPSSARFTGRERELWTIHSLLHPAQIVPAIDGPTVLINGASGLGKTELAAKYGSVFAMTYTGGVFWLNFSGYELANYSEGYAERAWISALRTSIKDHPWLTSGKLKFEESGKPLTFSEVRYQLTSLLDQQPSLWVLDNVPVIRPEDVRDKMLTVWLAPGPISRTIITTRDTRSFGSRAAISLDVLPRQDALRLLQRFRPFGAELPLAGELVDEVGAHTLALVLLGHRLKFATGYAFVLQSIRERGVLRRVEELAEWARNELELGEKTNGILATLTSSLASLSNTAIALLAIASTCAPSEPIPLWMIRDCHDRLQKPGADEATANTDRVDAALAELMGSSLLRERDTGKITGLEIHLLTAAAVWAYTKLPIEFFQSHLTHLLLARSIFPPEGDSSSEASISAHIRHLVQNSPSEFAVRLALRFAADDEWMKMRAVEIARSSLGDAHPYTLVALNNAASHLRFSEPKLAREYYTEVLTIVQPALGEHHALILGITLARASVLKSDWARSDHLEFLTEAQKSEEKVLASAMHHLGPDHPLTISAMKLLASTCWCLGELTTTQQLDEQIFSFCQRILGDDDLRTQAAKVNLKLSTESDAGQTYELDRRGFRTYTRRWDAEHPRTLYDMSNVALHSGAVATARDLLAISVRGVSQITAQEISHEKTLLELTGNYFDRVDETEHVVREIGGETLRVTLAQEYSNTRGIQYVAVDEDRRGLTFVSNPNVFGADFDVIGLMQEIGRNLLVVDELDSAHFLVGNAVELQRRFLGEPSTEALSSLEAIVALRTQRAEQHRAEMPTAGLPDDQPVGGKVSRNAVCPCGSGKKFKHCHGKLAW